MNNMEYCAQWLSNLVKQDKNVYLLIIDGWENYLFDEGKKSMTDEQKSRIINMGISEQNAVGFAAGLALGGKKVYIVMFAAFLTSRAAEQIKLDVAYNNANVTLIGIHGGATGPQIAGYSHWALEDIACLNGYPNIEILTPAACESEIESCLQYSLKHNGPVYIRIDTPGYPLYKSDKKAQIGSLSFIKKPLHPKFAVISYGNATNKMHEYAEKLDKLGHRYIFCSAFSLKPFDYDGLSKILHHNIPIITIEEHSRYGGLSSIVAEQIAIHNKNIPFKPITITNKKFNQVFAGDLSIDNLFGGNPLQTIFSFIEKDKSILKYFYGIKNRCDRKNRICKTYTLFCIPLLEKKLSKNGDKSYYVFGIKLWNKKN